MSSSSSDSLGKKHYGNQDPLISVVENDRPGQLGRKRELSGNFSSTEYSKLDYVCVRSSQEWKSEGTTHDRSGQLDKASWGMLQHVRPGHEEILLGGTEQSVRYGQPLRDRSGQLDNDNSQEVANSKNFIMGRDATEFVNRVNDQVRKRQKRMSNLAGQGEEHSVFW